MLWYLQKASIDRLCYDERMPLRPARTRGSRSDCPIACTLDLVGDKWTLLIIRDLLFGDSRYRELRAGEGIPTNILAERLRRLVAAGLITKEGSRPQVQYRLTPKGRALGPVIGALESWGLRYVPGTRSRPAVRPSTASAPQSVRQRLTPPRPRKR